MTARCSRAKRWRCCVPRRASLVTFVAWRESTAPTPPVEQRRSGRRSPRPAADGRDSHSGRRAPDARVAPEGPRVLALVDGRALAARCRSASRCSAARDRAPMLAVRGRRSLIESMRVPTAAQRRPRSGHSTMPRRKAAVRSLLERAGETRGRARVALGRDEALVRRVTMPAATEENLRQVLEFEMDRLTPFRADEVYFDYRVVSRDAAAGQLDSSSPWRAATLVDARVRELRDLGVSVQGVAIREDAGARGNAARPPALGAARRARDRRASASCSASWSGTVAGPALRGAACYPGLPQARDLHRVAIPLVNQARQEAETTDALARDLERQVADYNYPARAQARHAIRRSPLIEDVSRLLPDNTWVQQFDVKTTGKTREVAISGETASSSKLIEILERLDAAAERRVPRHRERAARRPGTERFMIAAEVKPRAQPESKPVLDRHRDAPLRRSRKPAAPATPAPSRPPATARTGSPRPAPPPKAKGPAQVSAIALPRTEQTAAASSRSRRSSARSSSPPRSSWSRSGCCTATTTRPSRTASTSSIATSASPSTRPIVATRARGHAGQGYARFFLRSGAAALSAAEAQEAVRSLVESSGGRLVTMQAPVSKDDGHYRQMTANVQIAANIVALRKILHAIENNTPYLFVDNLTVRTQVAGQLQARAGRRAGDVRAVRRVGLLAHGGRHDGLDARQSAPRPAGLRGRRCSPSPSDSRSPSDRASRPRSTRARPSAAFRPKRSCCRRSRPWAPSRLIRRPWRARSSSRRAARRPRRRSPRKAHCRRGSTCCQGMIVVGDNRIAMLREKSTGKVTRVERGKEFNGMKVVADRDGSRDARRRQRRGKARC